MPDDKEDRHSEGATGVPVKEPLLLWEGIECLRAEKRSMHLLTLTVDDLPEGCRLSAQAHLEDSAPAVLLTQSHLESLFPLSRDRPLRCYGKAMKWSRSVVRMGRRLCLI